MSAIESPPSIKNFTQQESIYSFTDYWHILLKRKWTILTIFTIVVVMTILTAYRIQPLYEGVSKISIGVDQQKVLSMQDVYWMANTSEEAKILESRSLAKNVYERLSPQLGQKFSNNSYEDPASILQYQLSIQQVRGTRLIEVKIKHSNPKLAALIANTFTQEYIDYVLKKRLESAQYALNWLKEQVVAIRKDVESSESSLQRYIEENQIVHLPKIEEGKEKDQMITNLETLKANLETQMAELSKRYKANHPKFIQIQSAYTTVSSRLKQEIDSVLDLNRKATQFAILQREVESNRSIYDSIVSKVKETNLFESLKQSNVSIVDPAEIPRYPVYPNKTKMVLFASIAGLLLGCGFAILLENLDSTIKGIDEIQSLTGLPVWGSIPDYNRLNKNIKTHEIDLGCHLDGKSIFSESYRYIRTGIAFSSSDKHIQTILVTSSIPKEGKTTDAINLAITYAISGEKVLLIDADLRNPRVHKAFNPKNKSLGLSNILVGDVKANEAISETQVPNLFLLPAGHNAPNPSELIISSRMKEFLVWAKGNYDRIIVDSAPVMAVADAIILSSILDGVLFVIRNGFTQRKQILQSINKLRESHARILGVILNRTGGISDGYGYGSYGYGENKENKDRPNLVERILKSV